MNGLVGLRFFFRNGTSNFQVKVPMEEVESILLKFRSGKDEIVGGREGFPGGILWALKLSDVQSIHTYDWQQYEAMLRQQQAGEMGIPPPLLAGYSGFPRTKK